MAVDDDHLYVAQRGIYALDRASGAVEWEAFREGPADPTPPAAYDGTVYVGLDDGRCAALAAADGTVRWTQDTGVYAAGMPIERDGRVYVGGHYASTDDGVVLALNPEDGAEQWRARTGSVLADGQPAVADDTVYVGTSSGHLHAHDRATGDEEWTFPIEENSVSHVSQPAAGSSVYTKGYGEYLYAIDPASGEEEWRVALGRGAVTPTFVDGTLLAASADGLFAIETDGA